MIEERDRRADAPTLRKANQYEYFILLPDDWYKQVWDLIISLILMFTFFATPYRIGFVDKDNTTWVTLDYCIDFAFF